MAPRPTNLSRRRKLLAFAPALVVVGLTALTASGASVINGATAATSVGINGEIASLGTTDPSASGACGTLAIAGDFSTTATASAVCRMSFDTNNASGASVTYANALAGGVVPFFCSDTDASGAYVPGTRSCADDDSLDNVPAGNSAIADGSDTFGLAFVGVSGGGSVARGTDTTDPTTGSGTQALADSVWWPVNGTSRQLCATSTGNLGSTANCDFKFGGAGAGATQGSGDYFGSINLTQTAL